MNWRRFIRDPLDIRSALRTLMALAVLAIVAGVAVVAIGLYNVSARSGHWPGVSWVLHSTFRSSVALRAHAEPPADLQSDARIALGAGHYESACRPCHASPGEARSATMRAMLPAPPHITEAVTDWEPNELHWIVHNGIKMSGMPAWPAERSDDVWPVVAFLLAVQDMTAGDYARLTRKAPDSCTMCHGEDGMSGNPHVPRLDILSEAYIDSSLRAYRTGTRDSGLMAQALGALPEETIARLAKRYAGVSPKGAAGAMTPLDERGRALAAARGTADVPACRACHGPWPEPLNPGFPSLAGQHARYLETQLVLWRDANRGGGQAAQLMHHAARDLTDDEIAALAAYYSTLAPAKLNAMGR